MTESVRLAKRLAELVPCSRREAELYIAGGWALVDGVMVDIPQFMVTQETVTLHPEATLTPIAPATMLFHLPPGMNADDAKELLSADTQSMDDPADIRLLKQHFSHLTQSLPIELNACGLLVFTQDWRVTRKLNEDAATLEQEYVVEVAGELSPDGLKLLNHGLSFNGRRLPPIKVSWQNETRLRFALKGAQPGQITHMCKSVGLQVLSMKRIRIGSVAMSKLQPGLWRYLMLHERF